MLMNLNSKSILLILAGLRGQDKIVYTSEYVKQLTGSFDYIDVWKLALGPLFSPSWDTRREALSVSVILTEAMVRKKRSFTMECHMINRRIRAIMLLADESGYEVKNVNTNNHLNGSVLNFDDPTDAIVKNSLESLSNGL
jgi:predicted ABC-type ATPase